MNQSSFQSSQASDYMFNSYSMGNIVVGQDQSNLSSSYLIQNQQFKQLQTQQRLTLNQELFETDPLFFRAYATLLGSRSDDQELKRIAFEYLEIERDIEREKERQQRKKKENIQKKQQQQKQASGQQNELNSNIQSPQIKQDNQLNPPPKTSQKQQQQQKQRDGQSQQQQLPPILALQKARQQIIQLQNLLKNQQQQIETIYLSNNKDQRVLNQYKRQLQEKVIQNSALLNEQFMEKHLEELKNIIVENTEPLGRVEGNNSQQIDQQDDIEKKVQKDLKDLNDKLEKLQKESKNLEKLIQITEQQSVNTIKKIEQLRKKRANQIDNNQPNSNPLLSPASSTIQINLKSNIILDKFIQSIQQNTQPLNQKLFSPSEQLIKNPDFYSKQISETKKQIQQKKLQIKQLITLKQQKINRKSMLLLRIAKLESQLETILNKNNEVQRNIKQSQQMNDDDHVNLYTSQYISDKIHTTGQERILQAYSQRCSTVKISQDINKSSDNNRQSEIRQTSNIINPQHYANPMTINMPSSRQFIQVNSNDFDKSFFGIFASIKKYSHLISLVMILWFVVLVCGFCFKLHIRNDLNDLHEVVIESQQANQGFIIEQASNSEPKERIKIFSQSNTSNTIDKDSIIKKVSIDIDGVSPYSNDNISEDLDFKPQYR